MQVTPVIAVHLTASLAALVIGPVALWTRRGHTSGRRSPEYLRPVGCGASLLGNGPTQRSTTRLHRAAGYAWVTLMLLSANSALFIRDFQLPNIAGYTPIHLLIPLTFGSLLVAFIALHRGNIRLHRVWMISLYFSACVGAGVFTLLPNRYLGQLLWGQWLGLL